MIVNFVRFGYFWLDVVRFRVGVGVGYVKDIGFFRVGYSSRGVFNDVVVEGDF